MLIKAIIIHGRQSPPLIIGLCIGIALSLILTPIEEYCEASEARRASEASQRGFGTFRDFEDYEPRIILRNYTIEEKTQFAKHEKLARPRYYTTELGIREKLLVAVASEKRTIASFGPKLNRTLAQHVNKLIFFLEGSGSKKFNLNLPIVAFKEARPLIKILRILSYLSDNYQSEYDYFFIVSDKTYVHGRRLKRLVEKISISENLYMGTLMDEPQSVYCNLDSGIILSQSILRGIGESLDWCIRNAYSEDPSDNLGRCILHLGTPCTQGVQGQAYASYRLREGVNVKQHLDLVGTSALVKEAVTISNLNNSSDILNVHMYYLSNDIIEVNNSIETFRKEILLTKPRAPYIRREDTWPVGSPPPHYPHTRFDVVHWDTFNSTHFFLPDDFHNTKPIIGSDLHDIQSVINSSIGYMKRKAGDLLDYRGLEFGHRRVDAARGVDYILSLAFRDMTSGRIVSRKIEASRLLTEPEIIPMPYVTENTRVTLILPVTQQYLSQVTQFVGRYEAECMVKGEQTVLLLVLLYEPGMSSNGDDNDVFKALKDLALKYTHKHHESGSKVMWHTIRYPALPGITPSDLALLDLTTKQLQEDTLVLITRHTATLSNDFLNRVRMNTILGWQIFSAIPFTQYHPETIPDQDSYHRMDVNKNNGHFDIYNFDHISFYVSDYNTARKKLSETIPIVRTERDLKVNNPEGHIGPYGLFLRATDLHILRAPDPSLKLGYTDLKCDKFEMLSSGKEVCERQQGLSMGLRPQLSKILLDYIENGKNLL